MLMDLYENHKDSVSMINDMLKNMLQNSRVRKKLIENIVNISTYVKEDDINSYKQLIKAGMQYEDIKEKIKQDWFSIMSHCESGINLIAVFSECPEIKEDMKKRVEDIIGFSNWIDYKELFQGLASIDNEDASIIQRYLEEMFITDATLCEEEMELVEAIIEYKGLQQKGKYIEQILQGTQDSALVTQIIDKCKDTEVESVYERHKGLMRLYEISKTNPKIDLSVPQSIIGEIIRQQMEEQIDFLIEICGGKDSEIVSDGSGHHSITYQIKDNHLKIGIEGGNFKIKRIHRRFLQPIVRKKENNIVMEVYVYQDNNHDNITDEELLEVFKELYNDGLYWADAKKENLVRLLKDNTLPAYLKKRDDTKYGFEEHTECLEVLKKGEVAICDLAFIYSMDSPEYKSGKFMRGEQDPKVIELEKKLESRKQEER